MEKSNKEAFIEAWLAAVRALRSGEAQNPDVRSFSKLLSLYTTDDVPAIFEGTPYEGEDVK